MSLEWFFSKNEWKSVENVLYYNKFITSWRTYLFMMCKPIMLWKLNRQEKIFLGVMFRMFDKPCVCFWIQEKEVKLVDNFGLVFKLFRKEWFYLGNITTFWENIDFDREIAKLWYRVNQNFGHMFWKLTKKHINDSFQLSSKDLIFMKNW